ncbi:Alpha/Beta hydrolase protein [Leptodontidium sp. MPI-SDFR-AT-0119]|nr:Alpha/Beta hydrolase protein [Leptodontidium sp. MPI-SDFR-AT-0119]
MADYSKYGNFLAGEWIELAKSTAQSKGGSKESNDLQEMRQIENRRREKLARAILTMPDSVHIDDISIPALDASTIAARLYRPKATAGTSKLPLYIHLHGGGWHYGTLDTEEPYCMTLCADVAQAYERHQIAVLNVNYRHAPDYKFPTQADDAWAALSLAHDRDFCMKYGIAADQIIIGGTLRWGSFGDFDRIERDATDAERKEGSPSSETTGILPTVVAKLFCSMYLPDDNDETKSNEWVSPLLVPKESWNAILWPATSIHVAGADTFRDEGLLFHAKLQEIGIKTRLCIHAGYPHAFERFPQLEESVRWRAQVADDIQWLLTQREM